MWIVRHTAMLVLVVGLLLPSGLQRRCCCTQRTTASHSTATSTLVAVRDKSTSSLRPCCLANAKSKTKAAARSAETATAQLTYPPCRCSVAGTTAVVVTKAHSITTMDETGVFLDRSETAPIVGLAASNYGQIGQNQRIVGPPLRTILCRWVI